MKENFYVVNVTPGGLDSADFLWRVIYWFAGVNVSVSSILIGDESQIIQLTPWQAKWMEELLNKRRGLYSIRPLTEKDDPQGLIRKQLFDLKGGDPYEQRG